MITLAWEVFYYKRKEKNKVTNLDATIETKPAFQKKKNLERKTAEGVAKLRKREKGKKSVTIGDVFKPAKANVSYISVYPKYSDFKP